MKELQVGFIAWAPNYGDPKFSAAAPQGPAPGSYEVIIGGPRTRERVEAEIAAMEKQIGYLRNELASIEAMPCRVFDYDGALKCVTHNRLWGAVSAASVNGPCPGYRPGSER